MYMSHAHFAIKAFSNVLKCHVQVLLTIHAGEVIITDATS